MNDKELDELLATRWPWHKKPVTLANWEQLLSQAKALAEVTASTYLDAKRSEMPFWFVQKTRQTKWKAFRRFLRLHRRIGADL